jgi:hypothetical protein
MSDDVLESEMFGGTAETLEVDDTGRTYPVKRDLVDHSRLPLPLSSPPLAC